MFARIRGNFAARIKNGSKYGVLGATLGGGLGSFVSTLVVIAKNDPGDLPEFLKQLCYQYKCIHCYWNEEDMKTTSNRPDYHIECFSAANKTHVDDAIHQHQSENNAIIKNGLDNFFKEYWPLATVLPAFLGMTTGFVYGFFKNSANNLPAYLQLPLLQGEHRISIDEKKGDELAKKAPEKYLDDATYIIMTDPAILPCGHSMDATTVVKVSKCILCRKEFKKEDCWPNHSLTNLISEFVRKGNAEISGETPPDYLDPITSMVMENPVVISCGHTLDQSSLKNCTYCPHPECKKTFDPTNIRINYSLKSLISDLNKNSAAPVIITNNPSTFYAARQQEEPVDKREYKICPNN